MSEFEKWWSQQTMVQDHQVIRIAWNAAIAASVKVCSDKSHLYRAGTVSPTINECAEAIALLRDEGK